MTIDDLLKANGIVTGDISDYLGDVAGMLDAGLFVDRLVKYYTVTPNDVSGEYTYLETEVAGITNIMNGVVAKSPDPDVLITGTGTMTETTPCEVEEFYFARHGRGIVIDNGSSDVTIKALVAARTEANLLPELALELKNLLLFLKSRNTQSVFGSLQRISTISANARAENRVPAPVVKQTSYTITPWAL